MVTQEEKKRKAYFLILLIVLLMLQLGQSAKYFSEGDTVGAIITFVTFVVWSILVISFVKDYWAPWKQKKK